MNSTAETEIKQAIKKSSKSAIIIGLIVIVIGTIAVAYPAGIGKVSAIIIGVFLVMGGLTRMVFAVVSLSMGTMLWRYVYAILMVVSGIWILINPDMGLEALTMAIAIYFIVDGVTQLVYSFSLMPIGGGVFLLVSGIISAIIGIVILSKWPESSLYFLGIYIGIKFIIDGLMLAATGNAVNKSIESNPTAINH